MDGLCVDRLVYTYREMHGLSEEIQHGEGYRLLFLLFIEFINGRFPS